MKVEIDMTGYQPTDNIVDGMAAVASRVVVDNAMAGVVQSGLDYMISDIKFLRRWAAHSVALLPAEETVRLRAYMTRHNISFIPSAEPTH